MLGEEVVSLPGKQTTGVRHTVENPSSLLSLAYFILDFVLHLRCFPGVLCSDDGSRSSVSMKLNGTRYKSILQDLYSRDIPVFLERYGSLLTLEELKEFDTVSDDYEINWHLNHIRSLISPTSEDLKSRSAKVKNRRRAYMDKSVSVFAILDRKSEIHPSEESGITLDNVKGEIELRHVSFKYPTRLDVQIFRDLCLTIHSGKTVVLVGESGSGKSTVISLLQRFYNPDSGAIKLDGTEIQKFQLKWLRLQMGLVSQEPILFNDSIRANIAYGKDGEATKFEIQAASELANAHKFISSLHQGYDTVVGERGVHMSGGQKQRVAIARAIVKSPKILLLDEATSALDAESERVVQDALDRVMVNRTTVVVAHRLSTIKGADVIAVVKNGVIVEKGKHEKLISKSPPLFRVNRPCGF